MKRKQIIIFGAGGNCIDILDTINEINVYQGKEIYECVGFLDDNKALWGKRFHGVQVLGPLASAGEYRECWFINGIGSPSSFLKREDIIAESGIPLEKFETIVHPTASVSRLSELGRGVVVFQNVSITNNVRIGNHVIILPNSIVSHDNVIGGYTCIAGGVCISGNVEIGKLCYLGTNCCIKGNLKIGRLCLIGMGSVVLEDVQENSVVAGNPARFLRKAQSSLKDDNE